MDCILIFWLIFTIGYITFWTIFHILRIKKLSKERERKALNLPPTIEELLKEKKMRINISRPGPNNWRMVTIWKDNNRNRAESYELSPVSGMDISIEMNTLMKIEPYGPIEEKEGK